VSLGVKEALDIRCVLKHVKDRSRVSNKVCLWGRSMGAVAVLRHISEGKDVALAVLDSPFSSLRDLIYERAGQLIRLPKFMLSLVVGRLEARLLELGLSTDQLENLPRARLASTEVVFLACKEDSTVPYSQMEQLYLNYYGPKKAYFLKADHCELREATVLRLVWKDIKARFNQIDEGRKEPQREVILEREEADWSCSLFR
jgi:hypothetical protein